MELDFSMYQDLIVSQYNHMITVENWGENNLDAETFDKAFSQSQNSDQMLIWEHDFPRGKVRITVRKGVDYEEKTKWQLAQLGIIVGARAVADVVAVMQNGN